MAGAYFWSNSKVHICMAFPRKPVQNYWQTLVRCDFQLNPLPPASEESEWPGRTSGASWNSKLRSPLATLTLASPFRVLSSPVSSGPGDPRSLRVVDPSIEMSEAFLVFFEQSTQCYIFTTLYLCHTSIIAQSIKHAEFVQHIVFSPTCHAEKWRMMMEEALASRFP